MPFRPALKLALFTIICSASNSLAELQGFGGARGGPLVEYHFANLSAFDSQVSGNPLVVGGVGFGQISKTFHIGGGGGGGFLMNASENLEFAMGYGGLVLEYIMTPWLNGRLLLGGGGYAVQKVVSDTGIDIVVRKLASGGFFLVNPSLNGEIKVSNWMKIVVGLGFFVPTVSRLTSTTFNFNLLLGKG